MAAALQMRSYPLAVGRSEEEEEEEEDNAGADAGARLTKRLLGGGAGGPAKDPLAAATGAERPGAMKVGGLVL